MKFLLSILIPIIIGLGLIGLSVWLFFLAKEDNTYLLLFGLATAVLIPIGITLTTYGFNFKNRETTNKLSQLTKITEIDTLLNKAKSKEDQLELLKTEYQNLENNLRFNSEKIALQIRKEQLHKQAKEILKELGSIDKEIGIINSKFDDSNLPNEVQLLRERVFKKEVAIIRIGKKEIIYKRNFAAPIGPFPIDEVIFELVKKIERIQKKQLRNKVDKIEEKKQR
ncbi:hypothetical protein H2O64_01755 [Kordia sp. YSTF-M3]|uniref:Uncharacterized protein n=1 Tax=Kordia aestuariivivens TaxID=2759037 RepID=A0ABR7Q496_9FLAO|nr:hypothetical protein [Kordia aestuariivivens]MBC8753376.1 hypothetical protein [Kordia aestuariivivens]